MSSRLTLSVLAGPAGSASEVRVVTEHEYSIGRSDENDWVLVDPYVSKRHCLIKFDGRAWSVIDRSTNGTFVNDQALGPNISHTLQDGDRLRIGGFELEAQTAFNPFKHEPIEDSSPRSTHNAPWNTDIGLPSGFDSIAPMPIEDPGPTQSDNGLAIRDPFPPVSGNAVLPPKWWEEEDPPTAPPPVPDPIATPLDRPPRLPPVPPAQQPTLLEAFLRGAGMQGTEVVDADATMEQLGAVMRALVVGLRQVLIARAAVKGEFRIEQTQINSRGNNPLKFAAGDEDALASLITGSRRTNMSPPAAVTEALKDIRLHELASMHAMQAAVHSLLARLDPAPLKARADKHFGLPAQRKARAWEAYEALYAKVGRSLEDDFDSVFGKSFAMAYEQAQAEFAKKED